MAISEETRARFKECLGADYAADYPVHLEQRFPRVFENIVRLWGSPEMEPLFNELLVTKRSGRQGFPVEVADEILRLYRDYQKLGLARKEPPRAGDVWSWVDDVGYFGPERDR